MFADIRESRDTAFTQVEALAEARSLHPVLTSLPAVGVRTAARILTEIGGKDFAFTGHQASYADHAPVTRRSSAVTTHPGKETDLQMSPAPSASTDR